jgi:glycosyltransferase involved in cell wall biosynthesis
MTRDDAWRQLAAALQALGAMGESLAVLPLKVYLAAHKAGHVRPGISSAPDSQGVRPARADKRAIFTIASKNYLAYARVFCRSVEKFEPDVQRFVLLVDRIDGAFDPAQEPFTLVQIEDLDNIPNPGHLFFKYTVLELSTAVKPYFINYLIHHYGFSKVLYFDPDILVCEPLDRLWQLLDAHSMVLIPHITTPYEDNLKPTEIDINLAGIYNLGFLAVSDTPPTRTFLDWWQKRLYHYCTVEPEKGLFTDQRWVNFAPVMFDGVFILRDPSYNLAYWNLHSCAPGFSWRDGKPYLYDQPVVFFHFSGFAVENIEIISRHQNRFTLADLPQLRPLFEHYRNRLLVEGHPQARKWNYAFDFFDNGIPIPPAAKTIYRESGEMSQYFGNPFCTGTFGNFFGWLNQRAIADQKPASLPMTNLLARIYLNHPRLQREFPDPLDKDAAHFSEWLKNKGASLLKLDSVFVYHPPTAPPAIAPVSQHTSMATGTLHPKPRRPLHPKPRRPFGLNIAGFLKGEFGVAEAARTNVHAIRTTDIPYVLNNVSYSGHSQRDTTLSDFSLSNPYGINLIHVNADSTQVFRNVAGQDYFEGRYNIGLWWWEQAHFPDGWRRHFAHYQEIWAQSRFCQASFARVSPVPVKAMPHAVWLDETQIHPDRAHFDIPTGVLTYLFTFDYFSVFERKNPLALVEAYNRAFGSGKNTRLIIKSINSHLAPDKMAELRQRTSGMNVQLIDERLSRREMLSLLATCDCYVSLHRSEGFGQGLAEAMYLGKPVIATAYSGNMDFMTPNNSFLVNYSLVELDRACPPYEKGTLWAEPDIDHAAEMLQLVYRNRELAGEKAQRGAADMRANHSYRAVGAKMAERLRQIGGQAAPVVPPAVSTRIPAPNQPLVLQSEADTANAHRETIWFSPACEPEAARLL